MASVIKDKEELHRIISDAIRPSIGKALREAGAVPPPTAPAAAPPAPAPPAQATNQVSVSKVAAGQPGQKDMGNSDLQKGQITLDMVVEKLNSIRSGRSFKDENIAGQMQQYFNDLNDNEKLAFYAFLKGVAQIVTGEIPAQQAADPNKTKPELEVVSNKDGDVEGGGKVRHIKPNIIKRPTAPASSMGRENTTPPAPIVAKQR